MNRKQLIESLPVLLEYYDKLERWEENYNNRVVRQKEIEYAIAKGEKPPKKLPRQDAYLKGEEAKPEYPTIEELDDLSKSERLSLEKKTLGVYFTGHPLDEYPHLLNEFKFSIQDLMNGSINDGAIVKFPVVVSSITKKCSKKKKNYAVLILEDTTGRLEATVFPGTWTKLESKLEEDKIVIVIGKVTLIEQEDNDKPIVKFILNEIEVPDLQTSSLQSIYYRLSNGANIEFRPSDQSTIVNWDRAKSYMKGI